MGLFYWNIIDLKNGLLIRLIRPNVAVVANIVAIVAYSRRIVRRMRGSRVLNRHFMSAGRSVNAAEMTQMQRIARLLSPPCNLCIAAANTRERSAECAKRDAFEPPRTPSSIQSDFQGANPV